MKNEGELSLLTIFERDGYLGDKHAGRSFTNLFNLIEITFIIFIVCYFNCTEVSVLFLFLIQKVEPEALLLIGYVCTW